MQYIEHSGSKELKAELEIWSSRLIFLIISFTGVMSFFDQVPMYSSDFKTLASVGVFPYFKLIKDILIFLLFIILFPQYLMKYKSKLEIFIISLLTTTIIISFSYSYYLHADFYVLSGLRWVFPLYILIFLSAVNLFKERKNLEIIVYTLVFINFFSQIMQLALMPHWFGTSDFGISKRVMGIFMAPNTTAFFLCASISIIMYSKNFSFREKLLSFFIVMISIYFTKSGAGYVVLLIVTTLKLLDKKHLLPGVITICTLAIFLLYHLDSILGRENYLLLSGGDRLKLVLDIYDKIGVYSDEFGQYTNTANLMMSIFQPYLPLQATDSTFASVQGNLGYLGSFLYFSFILYVFIYCVIKKNKSAFSLLFVFFLFGFTTIIFEVYPVIYLAMFLYFYWDKGLNFANTKHPY
ncbi:hypothetical protein [Vibrio caribbeanicus]|uniref:hypothetical protein n=1 Tax=Vibrio caribbeanicus TaxID=701175 RepID=UPI0022845DA3|nr:hypothetical protein [Vibrio caribbeanicus]MCY9844238.1 hypothetical protein [Vibrio caribbeanicus]